MTVSIATFGAYTAFGNKLSMKVVLPALAIINIMSFPLFVFPLLISAVISGRGPTRHALLLSSLALALALALALSPSPSLSLSTSSVP